MTFSHEMSSSGCDAIETDQHQSPCPRALNAVGHLELAHELNDLLHGPLTHLRLRRHVTEVPVVPNDTSLGCQHERGIGMVIGLVDLVDQRRALDRAAGEVAMTGRAILSKDFLPSLSRPRKLGQRHFDRTATRPVWTKPPKAGDKQKRHSQHPKPRRLHASSSCHRATSSPSDRDRIHLLEGQEMTIRSLESRALDLPAGGSGMEPSRCEYSDQQRTRLLRNSLTDGQSS